MHKSAVQFLKTFLTALSPLLFAATLSLSAVLIQPESARAQAAIAPQLGQDFHVTHEKIEELKRSLPKTTEAKIFYHWTSPEVGMRWMMQGHINQGEVDFYNTPTGKLQSYGAGIYMATSKTSSEGFGDFCVVFKMEPGTLVYNDEVATKVFGRRLNNDEMTELGKSVPFIRDLNSDWHITHNSANLSHVEYGGVYGADAKIFKATDQLSLLKAIRAAKPFGDSANYLESFFHLMHYMDGISLQRAIRVAPENPWSQFEPHLFENFKKLNEAALTPAPNARRSYYWGADGQDQEAWADAQVVKEVPAILNGLYETHNAAYRGHGIRAGGTNAGATFLGSPQELAALLANPYLSVQHKPDPSGHGFLISYEYPSIHDYKRLKPLLSADVYEWLESFSPATLAHDKALESRLNQRIIEDLLRNLFREIHGKPIDPADFLQKFVSIHPFSDGNGRTSRLYLQKALVGAGQSLPPFYLSDLDLLVSKNNLTKLIESSSKAYLNLQKAMLGELIATNFGHNRAANYFHLKQFDSLTASLAPFGFGDDDVIKAQFDNDILHRRFHELFAQMKGPAWSMIADDTLPAAIELAQKYQLQPYLEFMSEKLQKQISELKPGPGLKESNEFLKNMMLYGKGLNGFAKAKRAYETKITQIVKKLDYLDPADFEILEQYMTSAPVEKQRRTLLALSTRFQKDVSNATLTDGIRERRHAFQHTISKSEILVLTGELLSGAITPKVFLSRLSKLPKIKHSPAALQLTPSQLLEISKKLNWKEKAAFFGSINLVRDTFDTDHGELLSDLVSSIESAPKEQTKEFREYLSLILQDATQRYSLDESQRQFVFDHWLRVADNSRYTFQTMMTGNEPAIYNRMVEVIEEDVNANVKLSDQNLNSLHQYIRYTLHHRKRLRISYKAWLAFLETNSFNAFAFDHLNSASFKSPLYYALMTHMNSNDKQRLEFLRTILNHSTQLPGQEQLRLELLKEGKRLLNKNTYEILVKEILTNSGGSNNAQAKVEKKASGILNVEVQNEFRKPSPDLASIINRLYNSPQLWNRLSDAQVNLLLQDASTLPALISHSETFLRYAPKVLASIIDRIHQLPDVAEVELNMKHVRTVYRRMLDNLQYGPMSEQSLKIMANTFSKMGTFTIFETIAIYQAIGEHMLKPEQAKARAQIKTHFLKTLKTMRLGKVLPETLYAFDDKNWNVILQSESFSEAELQMLTDIATKHYRSDLISYLAHRRNLVSLDTPYARAVLLSLARMPQRAADQHVEDLLLGMANRIYRSKEASVIPVVGADARALFSLLPLSMVSKAEKNYLSKLQHYRASGYAPKEVIDAVEADFRSPEFKADVYKRRFKREYSGPKTCQAVFSNQLFR